METVIIVYKRNNIELNYSTKKYFRLYEHGRMLAIQIVHTDEKGTSFFKGTRRHFVSNETFVRSYAKYAVV